MANNWIKDSDNRMLLFVSILVSFNLISFFTGSDQLLQLVEPVLILPILFFFFYKYSKIRIVLIGFLIFAIIGDLSSLVDLYAYGLEIETIAYCLGYLCLIYEAINRIRRLNISIVMSIYLIVVFAVNFYFLYNLYDIFQEAISNRIELALIAIRVISLFLFSLFSFTVYLSSESKQSILLLLMAICLTFSDIIYLIAEYYMYHWVFEILSKALYLSMFYCFYRYVVNHKKFSIPKAKFKKAFA